MAEYNLKFVQKIELEILEEFDRICQDNKIPYFLDSGTALGAIRHKGFIPWDDDIDIGMLREDYEKFLLIAPKELNKKYFLQNIQSDPGCPCLFSKIRKNGTIYQENNKVGMNMHMGIWIDIFPFDYISNKEKEQKKFLSKAKKYRNLFMLKKIPHINKPVNKTLKFYIKCIVRKICHIILQIIPDAYFIGKINIIIKKNQNNREYITCLFYRKPVVWRTSYLVPVTKIEFEGKQFLSVKDIDYYLSVQYGDYMKLPPVEQRVGHRPLYIKYEED